MAFFERKTWFFIADGFRMHLFETPGFNEKWRLIETREVEVTEKLSHNIGRERPGRGRKIGSDARFAVSGIDHHEKLEKDFLIELAAMLNKAANEDQFDQIVLAAPPRALGILRPKLHPALLAKSIGVFDKDLTQFSENDLVDYFKERLVRW